MVLAESAPVSASDSDISGGLEKDLAQVPSGCRALSSPSQMVRPSRNDSDLLAPGFLLTRTKLDSYSADSARAA